MPVRHRTSIDKTTTRITTKIGWPVFGFGDPVGVVVSLNPAALKQSQTIFLKEQNLKKSCVRFAIEKRTRSRETKE